MPVANNEEPLQVHIKTREHPTSHCLILVAYLDFEWMPTLRPNRVALHYRQLGSGITLMKRLGGIVITPLESAVIAWYQRSFDVYEGSLPRASTGSSGR